MKERSMSMTRKQLEEKFNEIVKKDTTMDKQESEALMNLYIRAWDDADVGRSYDMMTMSISMAAGAIEYLAWTGKIREAEDLCMLLNEIEAFRDEVQKDPTKSSWHMNKVEEV
jgi:hypothetical protein